MANKSLILIFIIGMICLASAVSAAPSLTDVVINTSSGEFYTNENINLTFTTNATTYSVNWKKENYSIYDMYIPFDTTTIKDITGNTTPANYGTTLNTTNGKYGSSYYFNGSSYIDTGKFGYTDELTTCVWSDINYTKTTSGFIGNWHYSSGISPLDSWVLYYQSGSIKTYVIDVSNTFKTITYATGTITGWHHFCLRYNSSHVSLFVDGENENTATHTLSGGLKQTGRNITIGSLQVDDFATYPIGYLDEIFTIGKSLSDERIKAIYDSKPNYLNYNMFDVADNISAEIIAYDDIGGETIVESNTEQIQDTLTLSLSMSNQSLVNINLPVIITLTTNSDASCKFAYEEFDFSTEGTSIGTERIHEATIAINKDEVKNIYFKCEYDSEIKNESITIKGVDRSFDNVIVTMGDSIFWDETIDNRSMELVRDALNNNHGYWGIEEINSAINAGCMSNLTGVCTSPVPTVERYQTTVIDNNPRIIVWETIVNDAFRNQGAPVSKEAYKEVYTTIANDIRTQLPDLELFVLTSTMDTSATIGEELSEYSDVAREYAVENELPFLEMSYIVDWNESWYKPADSIHLSQNGHNLLAPYITDVIVNSSDHTMTTSDWDYYKYCGDVDGILLGYNLSSPTMNCYGEDGGWPNGTQDWLIIKNIKESGFTIERADESFTMTTSARYEPSTEYIVTGTGAYQTITSDSSGRLVLDFTAQTDTIVTIELPLLTSTCMGIEDTIYDSFSIGAIGIILLAVTLIMAGLGAATGKGFDLSMIAATVGTMIVASIFYLIGIVITSSIAGALC